jgi:hypothetical protein
VAAADWAMWHPTIRSNSATCHLPIRPLSTNYRLPCHHMPYRHIIQHVHLPSQPATSAADVTPTTCHPSSGDTCHFRIGPTVRQKVQICLTCVITWSRHVSCMDLPCGAVRTCHVSVWTCHVSVRMDCTDCIVSKIFACLPFQTECNIFFIRTPFDKVNIPPESEDETDAMTQVSYDFEHFHF